MFTIRNEQIRIFSEYMSRQFEDRMLRHVEQAFPNRVPIDEEVLRHAIRREVATARDFGIEHTFDVERYLDLTFGFGWDGPGDIPCLQRILADETLSPEEKLDQVEEYAIDIAGLEFSTQY